MHGQEDANATLDALLRDADPRVLVYVDPDIDGVVAGCLLMAFLDEHNVKYSTYINPNRAHGFSLTLTGWWLGACLWRFWMNTTSSTVLI